MPKSQRFLMLYSGALTLVFAVTVLSAATRSHAKFDEIDVQRINVVEPDGTLRMTISNHARLPGIIVRGKEKPFDRPQAGMIFYNDEASEIGGLIFGGSRNDKGDIVNSGGSLSFDRFEANQVVQLLGVDDSEDRIAGLSVSDSPSGREVHRRIWLGRGDDGNSTLALLDGKGRKRLLMTVATDGTTAIKVLDEDGKTIRNLLE